MEPPCNRLTRCQELLADDVDRQTGLALVVVVRRSDGISEERESLPHHTSIQQRPLSSPLNDQQLPSALYVYHQAVSHHHRATFSLTSHRALREQSPIAYCYCPKPSPLVETRSSTYANLLIYPLSSSCLWSALLGYTRSCC
jgi:hypothetical protein